MDSAARPNGLAKQRWSGAGSSIPLGEQQVGLPDLWNTDRSHITGKRIAQLIAFAGDGKLRDGNSASQELRHLLAVVPSDRIGTWIDECLTDRFSDFGFVLQDIINEIGRRLGFDVIPGVYRGHPNEGYDGLWRIPDGNAILVESKASTSYSISLSRIAGYRKQIAPELSIAPEEISILLVVGSEDTEELEAQIRGSRYAWSVRVLGVQSLVRLLKLKETLGDPGVERQIQEILIPQEFTRLDRIVDLVFVTAEEAQTEEGELTEDPEGLAEDSPVASKAGFHAEIIPRLEKRFGGPLVKQSRVTWASPDGRVLVSCQVSKEFEREDMHFWFGLKRTTKEVLEKHTNAFCSFGLGTSRRVVLIPFCKLARLLECMYTSPDDSGRVRHWHVRFRHNNGKIELILTPNGHDVDVTEFLLSS